MSGRAQHTEIQALRFEDGAHESADHLVVVHHEDEALDVLEKADKWVLRALCHFSQVS
jgi:GTP cyclohydrolase II